MFTPDTKLTVVNDTFLFDLSPEVFVDEKKQCYQVLEFKRFNWLNIFKALFSATARNALREVSLLCVHPRLIISLLFRHPV